MKLAVMTSPVFFIEEDKILATLFEEGMTDLHLYKREPSRLYTERLLRLLPECFRGKVTAHKYFDLKKKYDLAGIHLDDQQQTAPDGYRGRKGVTCRRISELKDAKKRFNYVFLDGTFSQINGTSEHNASADLSSNEDTSQLTIGDLEAAAKKGLIDRHVYAMGGVTINNISLAKDLGFGGVVFNDDLWKHFCIHNENDYSAVIVYFRKIMNVVG